MGRLRSERDPEEASALSWQARSYLLPPFLLYYLIHKTHEIGQGRIYAYKSCATVGDLSDHASVCTYVAHDYR